MNDDENHAEKYFTVGSLDELVYDETTKNIQFPVDEIVNQAFEKLQDCLNIKDRKIFFMVRKPSPIVKSRLNYFNKKTYNLLLSHKSFFSDLLTPIFWLTHLQLHRKNQTHDIRELRSVVGTQWGRFLFPFDTDSSLSSIFRDSFTNSIPYFFSQCVHHLFIIVLNGNSPSTLQSFRMEICADLVKTFTHLEPLESLLSVSFSFYFRTSPEFQINTSDQPEKQKFEEPPSSLLPEEDLTTLIEMPRRKRPRSTSWNAAGISSLISQSTNRTSVPYEHNSKIVIQYPKDGEKDWTTDLPPLLPVPKSSSENCTKDNYNPNKETRSLLYRSRRPEILCDYNKMKKELDEKVVLKINEINDKKIEFQQLQKKIMNKPLIVLKKFTDDLRTFQLERKWSETPELHKRKELERMEEERKKKLEKERIEAEDERRRRRLQRKREREEEQDKRDKEQRMLEQMKEENKKKEEKETETENG